MGDASSAQANRLLAALGYPIWIVALVVLFTDLGRNRFMRIHAIQALGFTIAWVVIAIVLSILTAIPFFGWPFIIVWPFLKVAWLVLVIYYAYRTYQGEIFTIPIVSDLTSQYTKSA